MPNIEILTGATTDGNLIATVIITIQYSIAISGQCVPIKKKAEIQTESEYYDNITYMDKYRPSLLKRDIDIYPWRLKTDVVIQGTARTERPKRNLSINLICEGKKARFNREIIISGDRRIEQGRTGLRLTEPEPFIEMPIRYDKAYGGTDELAEDKFADPEELKFFEDMLDEEDNLESSEYSYPRNPAGKGYLIDPEGIIGLPWPNLEFPKERLTLEKVAAPLERWGDRSYPACFDWFSHAWFPRVAFFGEFPETHDGLTPMREVKMGILERDLPQKPLLKRPKHGFAQGAHPYMWRHRLQGDERIRITHMSKDGRDFYVMLPPHRPKIFVRLFGGKEQMAPPVLDLVFIETDENRVTLLWRGSVPMDREHLMPDWEKECEYRVVW
ncbi:MAG: hypothetical protein B6I30_06805 [Desulfobacteraceae bacterium 4572_187]|nr:MAG: hypothetical protein B6I30_06805 [Desulfobacteraceae bacterium 4572_187]